MFQKSAFTPNPKRRGIGFVFAGTKTSNSKSVFSQRIRITDDFYIWKLKLDSAPGGGLPYEMDGDARRKF